MNNQKRNIEMQEIKQDLDINNQNTERQEDSIKKMQQDFVNNHSQKQEINQQKNMSSNIVDTKEPNNSSSSDNLYVEQDTKDSTTEEGDKEKNNDLKPEITQDKENKKEQGKQDIEPAVEKDPNEIAIQQVKDDKSKDKDEKGKEGEKKKGEGVRVKPVEKKSWIKKYYAWDGNAFKTSLINGGILLGSHVVGLSFVNPIALAIVIYHTFQKLELKMKKQYQKIHYDTPEDKRKQVPVKVGLNTNDGIPVRVGEKGKGKIVLDTSDRSVPVRAGININEDKDSSVRIDIKENKKDGKESATMNFSYPPYPNAYDNIEVNKDKGAYKVFSNGKEVLSIPENLFTKEQVEQFKKDGSVVFTDEQKKFLENNDINLNLANDNVIEIEDEKTKKRMDATEYLKKAFKGAQFDKGGANFDKWLKVNNNKDKDNQKVSGNSLGCHGC